MTGPLYQTVYGLGIAATLAILLACLMPQDPSTTSRRNQKRSGHLDPSHAFYHPDFATQPKQVLARTSAGPIHVDTYLRYLAALHGTRYVEDLAFDILLAKECKARGLASSAPLLARSAAARRFHVSERERDTDPEGSLQRKFANEALRQLRVDALVAERRAADDVALKALFERLYGVGGERVQVRQILVSFAATGSRLEAAGKDAGKDAVQAAALERARGIQAELGAGKTFETMLEKTDDRIARRLLRDPEQRAKAGFLEGYNYRRYGEGFATAVRGLKVGELSKPVRSDTGYHLVVVVDRKTTRLADVEKDLREALRRGPAKPSEVQALRKDLLEKYRFQPGSGQR